MASEEQYSFPRHRDLYPGPSCRLPAMFLTQEASGARTGLWRKHLKARPALTQPGRPGGPVGSESLWFGATLCHFHSHVVLYASLGIGEPQLSYL